jgi:riboflavin kinase/FMN adenylyltransferase
VEPSAAAVGHAPLGRLTAKTPARQALVLEGFVVHGDQRGRKLGFPTANLVIDDEVATDGVWAGIVEVDGEMYVAVISIGRRATFYGRDGIRLLEAHLLDFADDLYDRRISVTLHCLLRPQRRFANVRTLIRQMHRDLHATCLWWQRSRSATVAWPDRTRFVSR